MTVRAVDFEFGKLREPVTIPVVGFRFRVNLRVGGMSMDVSLREASETLPSMVSSAEIKRAAGDSQLRGKKVREAGV